MSEVLLNHIRAKMHHSYGIAYYEEIQNSNEFLISFTFHSKGTGYILHKWDGMDDDDLSSSFVVQPGTNFIHLKKLRVYESMAHPARCVLVIEYYSHWLGIRFLPTKWNLVVLKFDFIGKRQLVNFPYLQ